MRILWLKTELLHPVDKGGRIRTYHMLRELRREHEIVYLALDDGSAGSSEVEAASEYCHELVRVPHRLAPRRSARFFAELAANAASRLPYAVQRYRSGALRDEIRRRDERGAHDVLVCDFLAPAVNLPARLAGPAVIFQHNVEAEIWRRHAEVASDPLRRAYFRSQWRRMRAFEGAACRRFDRVVAVSRADRDTLERDYGLDGVSVVETGVDVAYFTPADRRPMRPRHLVFTGSMDWLPNQDAMVWFVGDILPLIRERHPDVTLAIVGRDPTPAVRQLAARVPGVTVTGRVPDIRPWVEEAAIYVVPLRIGGGTRLKIYEAMGLERPVVSTSVGMEGLPVGHGEELRVADGAPAFAEEVVGLLERPEAARALGARAAARVRRDFSWARVATDFSRACEDACARVETRLRPPVEEDVVQCR